MQKAGKRQRTRDAPYTKFQAAVRAQNVKVSRCDYFFVGKNYS